MSSAEVTGTEPYYFELPTGNLYTNEACIEAVEAERGPRNLQDLRAIGRLLVATGAVVERIALDNSHAEIQKLEAILRDRNNPIPPRRYEPLPTDHWHIEDHEQYGAWLSKLPRQADQAQLDRFMLIQASRLGIGPGVFQILNRFGGKLSHYYNALQLDKVRRRSLYSHWSLEKEIECLISVREDENYASIEAGLAEKAREGKGPSRWSLYYRRKSVTGLLERHGYYSRYGVAKMDEQDLIEWGVLYKRANNGKDPSNGAVDYLSAKRRGPSRSPLRKYFGSLSEFRARVREEYEAEEERLAFERQQKLLYIEKGRDDGSLPDELLNSAASESQLFSVVARYRIIQEVLPWISEKEKQRCAQLKQPASFIQRIQKADPNITQAEIEIAADTLGVFDDIWPPDKSYMQYLRID